MPAGPAPAALTSTGVGTAPQERVVVLPAGGAGTLLQNGTLVSSLVVPGVGRYEWQAGTSSVQFTAELGYTGTASPVTYRVTDSYGQTATASYTPTVTAPAATALGNLTTTGVGTTVQLSTAAVPAGGSITLLEGSTPTSSVVVPGVGTYTLTPTTGELTFEAVHGFHGTVPAVTFQTTDAYGQRSTATYQATVTPPAAPAPEAKTSTGVGTAAQTVTAVIPLGGTLVLLAGSTPATSVTLEQGTYTLDTSTGTITFTPAPGFVGEVPAVTYLVTDASGQTGSATYTPSVTAIPAAPAPAAPTSSAPASKPKPTATSTKPHATASTAVRHVVTDRAATMLVTCALSVGRVTRCVASVYATIDGRRQLIGRAVQSVPLGSAGVRALTVRVPLNAAGRSLAAQPGGAAVTTEVVVTRRGSTTTLRATQPSRIQAKTFMLARPVYFEPDSSTVSAADRRYLNKLRAEMTGVRRVDCAGFTDSDNDGGYNAALAMRRAKAVCNILTNGTDVDTRITSHGERNPIASNSHAAGKALNRRTEIRLIY